MKNSMEEPEIALPARTQLPASLARLKDETLCTIVQDPSLKSPIGPPCPDSRSSLGTNSAGLPQAEVRAFSKCMTVNTEI